MWYIYMNIYEYMRAALNLAIEKRLKESPENEKFINT